MRILDQYRGYRDYALDNPDDRFHFPRLWAMREVLFDYCETCFNHYYTYLVWRGKAPPRGSL